MYETIFAKIGTTLGNVSLVKDSFYVPKKKTAYPAVFYKPSGATNTFETQTENMKIYRFLMIVMVGAGGTTAANAFGTVLPRAVDAIIAQFDEEWNQGVVDGHRMTAKVDSADAWEMSQEEDGLIAYAPLNLEVRVLTNN